MPHLPQEANSIAIIPSVGEVGKPMLRPAPGSVETTVNEYDRRMMTRATDTIIAFLYYCLHAETRRETVEDTGLPFLKPVGQTKLTRLKTVVRGDDERRGQMRKGEDCHGFHFSLFQDGTWISGCSQNHNSEVQNKHNHH